MGGAFLSKLFQSVNYRIPVLLAGLILIGLMFVDAARIHPDYLAFTSPLGGDKESWQLLSDSNIEWGEDVGDLARYLKAKGESEVTASLSGGATVLELYGIRATAFAPRDLQHSSTRYVALGAGYLNGSTLPPEVGIRLPAEERHNYFSKYRDLEFEATFGGSIFLYRRKD
jgi:hypothetical protein